jgi:hypothetical protein
VHLLHGDYIFGVAGPHDVEDKGLSWFHCLVKCSTCMCNRPAQMMVICSAQWGICPARSIQVLLLTHLAIWTQVVDAPEVLTIIDSMPELSQFLNSLYNCQYHEFFKVHDLVAWQCYVHSAVPYCSFATSANTLMLLHKSQCGVLMTVQLCRHS